MGGTRAIPNALTKLAIELGVEFRTNCPIKRIATEKSSVTGIETNKGEFIRFDAVVANSDAVRTHRELIGGEPAERFNRKRSYEPACSGVVIYLGLDRKYDHLEHHNFVFSRDAAEEFHAIYEKGELAPDPTAYLCAPSRTDGAVAPKGGEALYVLVHTPYLRPGHDWRVMYPAYRKLIFEKLARTAGLKDLESRIRFERFLTPKDIHERYAVLNGAIYGIASHGRFQGGFKPANHSTDIAGLYLAGGAAHPGPGMPMVMMSGWIAADRLDSDGRVQRQMSRAVGL
jgi:diapolycopene oxygenase